jgi:acetyl-CoA acetyltransferase
MKMDAYVAGVGMTRFGNHLTTRLKDLAAEAIRAALADAGLGPDDVEAAYMGNAAAGVLQGQEMIRGQAVLRSLGIGRIPVINVENACATSSTAFAQAAAMVTAGAHDVVLVCGYEKLFNEDKQKSFLAFDGAVDTEDPNGGAALARYPGGRGSRCRAGRQVAQRVRRHLRLHDQGAHAPLRHDP